MDVRKRRQAYIILSILFTIVVAIGFSYAYFVNRIDNDALTNIIVAFDGGAEFKTTSSTEAINIAPDKLKMFQSSYDQVAAVGSSYIDVELKAIDQTGYTCSFDFVWVWNEGDQYRVSADDVKELTVYSIYGEKQVPNYGNTMVIASSYISTSGSVVETERYDFTTKFYNLANVDQSGLAGKNYSGSIKVDNVVCKKTLSGEVLGLVSNNEYTSSQDSTKYVVRHEEVEYEGTTYDAGVRYEGNAPDNYVRFNGNEEWRIIGVFEGSTIGLEPGKQYTKIIRNIPMYKEWDCDDHDGDGYCWDDGGHENDWTNSTLNTYLNGEYLDSMTASNKIAQYNGNYSTWYLRGTSSYYDGTYDSAKLYLAERITGGPGYKDGTAGAALPETQAAIGLMYPSDYGYGAYGSACDNASRKDLTYYYDNGCASVDWLLLEDAYEWLISPYPDGSSDAFIVYGVDNGSVGSDDSAFGHATRPVLYLEADTMVASGNGTKLNPYTLNY